MTHEFTRVPPQATGALTPSPQARHHFTRSDQVDQLIGASAADPDTGFMARLMALCSLPRTNPGDRKEYKRVNGPYTLGMLAGLDNKLPFGSIPRLLLAWVCTEAVHTQSRDLVLGRSLSEFMRTLGILSSDSGGATGIRTRLRNQMKRLFRCQISLIYKDAHGEASVSSLIADRTELWWDLKCPDEPVLWDSKVRLGEEFFKEIIRHPIPLDMHILRALTRSSIGLDLYMWLTCRTFGIEDPIRLTWPQLYGQFGLDPNKENNRRTVDDFRKECLRELKKIKVAWPGLDYATPKGALVLLPTTTPSIPPLLFPPR